MSSIQPSVIYDDKGEPVAVVVPYKDWLESSKGPRKKAGKKLLKASDIKQKLTWPVDPLDYQRKMREEWDR